MAWKVKGRETVKGLRCSLVEIDKVHVEPIPREKIELLMKEYPHQEWMAYLVGEKKENSYRVKDIAVPPHAYAGAGSAEAEPFSQPEGCVGVIHSHHGMGAFHSGTDHNHVDRNYPISVTVARKARELEWDVATFAVTPCGKALEGKSEISFLNPKPLFNHKAFLDEAKANIRKGKGREIQSVKMDSEAEINRGDGHFPIKYHGYPGLLPPDASIQDVWDRLDSREPKLPDDEYQAMLKAFEEEEAEEMRLLEEKEELET